MPSFSLHILSLSILSYLPLHFDTVLCVIFPLLVLQKGLMLLLQLICDNSRRRFCLITIDRLQNLVHLMPDCLQASFPNSRTRLEPLKH